jgi:predicted AlkP superfamily pyrophosphatase or phosphodiesterase
MKKMKAPVVFVMLDGVRPDALLRVKCPTIKDLMRRGSATLSASSVMPSVTLPCHMSIFHSVPPDRHGITSNVFTPMARPLPGLIEVLKQNKKRSAFFYNWEPLKDLSRPGSLDYSFFLDYKTFPEADEKVVSHAIQFFSKDQVDFAFVYIGLIDELGHQFGWMSETYLKEIEKADEKLTRLIAALPKETTYLLQSDHGGHDRNHGSADPLDMTIPWIVCGPQIKANFKITSPVSLLDTAPTLAHILGVEAPVEWEGRVVQEIFKA